jgi:hypothetical protein
VDGVDRRVMMDVAEFTETYMRESGLTPYEVTGDVVIYAGHDGFQWKRHVLRCECDERGCHGWAMVHPEGYNFGNYIPS